VVMVVVVVVMVVVMVVVVLMMVIQGFWYMNAVCHSETSALARTL